MKKIITFLSIAFYAVTVHGQSAGDYRSIKTGNWTDVTVWQRYNGTKWVAAAVYPTSADGIITIQDITTVTINASLTIDQTIVDAGGQLNLVANYTVSLNNTTGDDLIVNGLFSWAAGTIDGAGAIGVNGTLNWTGGNLKVSLTSQGTVTMYNVYLYPTSVFINNGTANSYTDANMIVFAGGKFTNNHIFNAYGNGVFYNSTGGGIFTNSATGIFNVQCTEYITNNITFNNKGVMNFMMGSFYNYSGTFTNTKTMNFSGGGYQNRGAASIEKGSKITGNGYITLNALTMSFNIAVSLPAGITINIYGGSNLAGTGSVTLNGILNWDYGSISVPFTIGAQGSAYIYNYSGYLYNTLTNNGTINWNGYDLRMYDGAVINNNTFNINCNDNLIQYNTTHPGSFTNNLSGTVIKNLVGLTTVSIPFASKGTITGMGDFAFGTNLTNTGTFDPGAGDSTAILTTGTNYTNKTLSIRITGANPGLDFDRLLVNGNATLGGSTLKVTSSGNVPAGAYVILNCTGTRSGTFGTTNLPAGYTVTYKTNQVVLNVPAPFTAQAVNEADDITAKSLNNNLLSVSPNPASQSLNISFQSKSKSASLKIFDENGKSLLQKTVTPSISNNINISKLTPGSYVVQLNDGERTSSARFIKQ